MQLLKGKSHVSRPYCLNTLTSSTHINQTKLLFNQAVKPNGILILRIWSWGTESIVVNSSAKSSKCQTAAILFTTILISGNTGVKRNLLVNKTPLICSCSESAWFATNSLTSGGPLLSMAWVHAGV